MGLFLLTSALGLGGLMRIGRDFWLGRLTAVAAASSVLG